MRKVANLFAVMCLFFSTVAFAKWSYHPELDRMTDKDKSVAMIVTEELQMLVVKCRGTSDFEIFVNTGNLGQGSSQVVYRVDQNRAVSAGRWATNASGRSAFVPHKLKSTLVNALKKGNEITFQLTDFRGSKLYASFPLAGSSAAIGKLTCI